MKPSRQNNYVGEAQCECGSRGLWITDITPDGRQRVHCTSCHGHWRIQRQHGRVTVTKVEVSA